MSNEEFDKQSNTTEQLLEEIEKPKTKVVHKKTRKLKKEVILIGTLTALIAGVLLLQALSPKDKVVDKDNLIDDGTVYTGLVFDQPMKQILQILTLDANGHQKLFNNDASTIEYSDIKNYREENLSRYQAYHALHPDLLHAEVIWRVNVNFDYDLYTNVEIVEDPNDYNVVVNKHFKLDGAYVPEDLVLMDSISQEFYLREEANTMFKEMQEAMAKNDLKIGVEKAYNNYNFLSQEYNDYVTEHGEEKALYGSAKAGHSEYQLGLSLIVNDTLTDSSKFHESETYHWLTLNAHRYGFIFRYQADETITGYSKNLSHLRYVGKDTAVDMYEKNNHILEEYLDKHGN